MKNAMELMKKRAEFGATGIIKNITGENGKVCGSGWVGSNATITMEINGTTQKIKVFGGVGKSELPIRVFLKDADGKAMRDANGKTIQQQIPVDLYDDNKFKTFDKREIIEWGEKNSDGKAQKVVYASELTSGRFANALLSNKDLLIGRRVLIKGEATFKPSQNFDKIQIEMGVKSITLLKTEEGKETIDKFIINAPIILNKEVLSSIKDGKVQVYVPVYHKYVNPQQNGEKGRTVYVATNFEANENGFMAIDSSLGFDLEARKMMLENKVNIVSQGTPFVVMDTCLSNKSGVVEREIKIEELTQDPVYGFLAQQSIKNGKVEDFLKMYKLQNPMTVKSEYKQQIDFISPLQFKDEESGMVRDCIFGIAPQSFEVVTLDTIKSETEIIKAQKTNVTNTAQTPQTPVTNTPKKVDVPQPPVMDINQIDNMDDFPF